jgi:hypothetical protein
LIAFNSKVKGIRRWTTKYQLGTRFRKIVDNAFRGIAIRPERQAPPENFPTRRTPPVRILSSIVNLTELNPLGICIGLHVLISSLRKANHARIRMRAISYCPVKLRFRLFTLFSSGRVNLRCRKVADGSMLSKNDF